MGHTPLRVFDCRFPDYQNSLEMRTKQFEESVARLSVSGGMEEDIEFLSQFYGVPHPYE